MEFVHSVMRTTELIAADGEEVLDLPVNPLSVILINIKPLNNTATITDYSVIAEILTAIDSLRIEWRGGSIIDMSGQDLAAYAFYAQGLVPWASNVVETNNDRRSVVLPIVFGRRAYDANECLPATKRGEMQMTIDWDIASGGYDAVTRSIETVELIGATPAFFQRATTLAQTFAAIGDNDVDLPIGNILRGILAFGTTGFAGATPAPTLGRMKLLINNLERSYSTTDFETSRAIIGLMGRGYPALLDHFHAVNAAGGAQEDSQAEQLEGALHELYTYLQLDPTGDDEYSVATEGSGRVNLRINAEAANAVRIIPVEKVAVAGFFK